MQNMYKGNCEKSIDDLDTYFAYIYIQSRPNKVLQVISSGTVKNNDKIFFQCFNVRQVILYDREGIDIESDY